MTAASRGRRLPRAPAWLVLAAGFALLAVAWALADPPFANPDEPTNLVKAAAVGRGELDGPRVAPFVAGPGQTALQAASGNQQSRGVVIPAGLLPPPVVCFVFRPDTTADCLRAPPVPDPGRLVSTYTYVGSYPPFAYLVPGLAIRLTSDLLVADYLGRLALALLCALLLGAAAWVLARVSPASLAGLTLAVTPMVLFHASGLAATGVEICAAICFGASLIGVTRDDPPPGVPAVLAVSGAILAVTRPFGPIYLAGLGLAALPLLRRATLRRRPVLLAALAVGLAAAFGIAWSLLHQPPHRLALGPVLDGLGQLANQTPDLEFSIVGIFGWDDTYLPLWLYNPWWLLLLLLVIGALVLGSWRERLAILLAIASTALVAAAFYGFALSPAWWRIEARFVLPALVMIPLLVGHVLGAARRLPPAAWPALAGFVGVLQFLALWYNERRYAAGRDGPLLFLATARWSPPVGWLLPFTLAGLGALLIVAAFAIAVRASPGTPAASAPR